MKQSRESKNIKPLDRLRATQPSLAGLRSSGPIFDPTTKLKQDVKCKYCGLAFNTGSQVMKTHCSRQCRQNAYTFRKTGRRPVSSAQIDRAVDSFILSNDPHNIHCKSSYFNDLRKLLVTPVILCSLILGTTTPALPASKPNKTEVFKITAYCSCFKCCGKSDGITASNKPAKAGRTVALNWLPFGTKLNIAGKLYVVEDRGAESQFGTYYHRKGPKNKIKHVDIYFDSHSTARQFGVKWLPVEIVK